jgi:hypothetical protein
MAETENTVPTDQIRSAVFCHAEAALKRLEKLVTDAEGELTQAMSAAEQKLYYDGPGRMKEPAGT